MEARLQRRIQRYGWDRAASEYERGWRAQLAPAHVRVLARAALCPGARVLDVACGTGLASLPAARAVGVTGQVLGVDLSGEMVTQAQALAADHAIDNATFARMDAEALALEDASFDVALCALGLMFVPEPQRAIAEMRRVVRPGGRVVIAVWGERARCAWSSVFEIVEAEVASEVCPLFFRLGRADTLADDCTRAGLVDVRTERLACTLDYASADEACAAALIGGPIALAWSRLDDAARARVRSRYVASIEPWRVDDRNRAAYRLPAEFVVTTAQVAAC